MKKTDFDAQVSNKQLEKEIKRTLLKRKRWTAFKRTVSTVIVLSAVLALTSTLWFPVYHITGESMEPTLERGMVVVAYRGAKLSRGSIVAMYNGHRVLINRLIGMPEDRIHIDGRGSVTVNDVLLHEDYLTDPVPGMTDLTYPYQVPAGRYFLMGDNRAKALDSRMGAIGCMEENAFAGKIIFCIWPLRRIGYIG